MYLTTFTDKDGIRLEHTKLKSIWNSKLKKYIEEKLIEYNLLKEDDFLQIGMECWYELKKLEIKPCMSNFLFDKNLSYEKSIAEVIILHCFSFNI
jgi:hypothetical protein